MNPAHLFRPNIDKPSRDHHSGPIIWADNNDYLHVVFMYYDDDKGHIPEKSYNPLYKRNVRNI
ncbi:MAG: hypothetical protein DRJ29_14865 [Bacteroidetes bacterium]|nr:MAG: hypothetical protein DRJ29_14865 [Bacteroidota bacterium]